MIYDKNKNKIEIVKTDTINPNIPNIIPDVITIFIDIKVTVIAPILSNIIKKNIVEIII